MPKLKIVDPGFQNYTGMLGQTEFVDGVSVENVPALLAQRLAGLMAMEDADTGHNPSIAQFMLDTRGINADEAMGAQQSAPEPEKPLTPVVKYTREQLEAIADEKGIKGLREIGDALDVHGSAMADLIEKILAKQTPT